MLTSPSLSSSMDTNVLLDTGGCEVAVPRLVRHGRPPDKSSKLHLLQKEEGKFCWCPPIIVDYANNKPAHQIKCSGRPPGSASCTNCSRDGLACSFVARGLVSRVTPSQHVTEAGTPRKRAQRACTQCHAHETKCSGSMPTCARCAKLAIECVYRPSKRNFSSAPGSVNLEAKQLVSPATSSSSLTTHLSAEYVSPPRCHLFFCASIIVL